MIWLTSVKPDLTVPVFPHSSEHKEHALRPEEARRSRFLLVSSVLASLALFSMHCLFAGIGMTQLPISCTCVKTRTLLSSSPLRALWVVSTPLLPGSHVPAVGVGAGVNLCFTYFKSLISFMIY